MGTTETWPATLNNKGAWRSKFGSCSCTM